MSKVFFLLLFFLASLDVSSARAEESAEAYFDSELMDSKAEMDLFYEAMKMSREGETEQARSMLEKIIRKQPPGAFRDDAFYELARISDEIERDYPEAIRRYELMIEQYPNARPARRAIRRVEYLKNAISSGTERLARYEAILKSSHKKSDPLKQIAEMNKVIESETPFALEWEALLWIALKYRSIDDCDEAVDVYERMENSADDPKRKREAALGRAECLMSLGNIIDARRMFEVLAKSKGFASDTARNRLLEMEQNAARKYLRYTSIALLLLALLLLAAMLPKKKLRGSEVFRPPFEMLALLPFFLALFVAALQEGSFAWHPVGMFLLISMISVYATPLLIKSFNPRSAKSKAVLFTMFALVLLSMIFLAIDSGNLYDQIIYDLEHSI